MAEAKKEEVKVDIDKLVAEAVAKATAAISGQYEAKIKDLTTTVDSLKNTGEAKPSGKLNTKKVKPTGKLYKAIYTLGNRISTSVKGRADLGELAYLGIVSAAGTVGIEAGKDLPVTESFKEFLETKYIIKEPNKYKIGNMIKYQDPKNKDKEFIEICPFEFEETSLKDLGLDK